ncbi:alkaline phosphatase family protein [Fundidesulfovibrio terrae]|uniref:alkaline phosphatase family protein n=1 Tax=Fundidesulfovibrio terrae TaxID=2922866 RepID=UPI001FAEDFFA|nr:alkaline phosphatase family protein [Fundidesulfovibrio terrae]
MHDQHNGRNRLVVLGLDGLPFSLAQSLCQGGKLPNLAHITLSANARAVRAELPELSPVNWASFVTGKNPGGHGVFGFSRIDPATYTLSLTDSSAIQAPTIFERLGEKGLTAKVVNLPGAYPARPMSGMLVAGFVAHDLQKAVHPPFLASILAGEGYVLEADTTRGVSDPDYLLSQVRATLRSRAKALDLFWPDLSWDMFMLVLTETDRIFHFFYPAVANPQHALHGAFMEFMAEWDRFIGVFLDRYDALAGPKRLIVLADHGFTECKTEVDLNVWLMKQGILKLRQRGANEFDSQAIAPHETAAFALDPGRIYINVKERFARGVFHQYIGDKLRSELKAALLELSHEGHLIMAAVHEPQDIYSGQFIHKAPDLICEPRPGISLTGKFDRLETCGLHGRFGCHTAGDAFFYDSQGSAPASVSAAGRELFVHFGLEP